MVSVLYLELEDNGFELMRKLPIAMLTIMCLCLLGCAYFPESMF